jgi:ABC-type glutathione transport system ATPase component
MPVYGSGVRKNPGGLTLVSTRHSAPQFPMHPYSLSILLADERTGNLDSQTGDQVFELLRRFNRDEGTAFLVVTHDPRIAGRCDGTVEMVDGRSCQTGRRKMTSPRPVRLR